jgi:response regulator RpfG family c-di-GMP phosphodiesterase
LRTLPVEVIQASSGQEALDLSLEHDFCLAVLDIEMPEMDGYQLAEHLRRNQITANLPIIFISAVYSDEYHHRQAYDTGAVDFLTTPLNKEVFLSKVKVFLALYQQRLELQQANDALAKRALQLETVGHVAQRATSVLNLEELLSVVVNQVKDNFGYYHAHIYLLDEEQQDLIMVEGTGEVGAKLKAQGHHILLNSTVSLVARAARTGEIVWVDNVRQAQDWLPNELLPDTYAEMAVPVISEDKVLGVLDVQENKIAAFDEGDASLMRSLAHHIAVAMTNARLFERSIQAREIAEQAQRSQTKTLVRLGSDLQSAVNNLLTEIQALQQQELNDVQIKQVETIQQQGAYLLNTIKEIGDLSTHE